MANHATPEFWELYAQLPLDIQALADAAFKLFVDDPRHPSLQFKKVRNFWSARVGRNYRVLAVEADDGLAWFWIGSHDEYERLIRAG